MTGPDVVEVVPMVREDIPRVLEIDQLSFPLPWSPTSYHYELTQNPNSHFWVAVAARPRPGDAASPAGDAPGPAGALKAGGALVRLMSSHWFRAPAPAASARHVVGYGGFWFILDEAHISTIAVHPDWRGRRVGERLFAALLEQSLDLGAATATLEVRVTNDRAQRLYGKYHFEVVGRRKHYYRDNGEDALLMTAELGPGYRDDMRRLFAQKRPGRNGAGEH